MFSPIKQTKFPPTQPLFLWDGECGFCKYWIIVWNQKTSGLTYKTYQEAGPEFPDIPIKEFKKASRLIESDGKVYSGPDSAFRTFFYFKKPAKIWHNWYHRSAVFQNLSNHGYNFIAKNRPMLMTLTKAFWGRNPVRQRPYWIVWLAGLIGLISTLIYLLD